LAFGVLFLGLISSLSRGPWVGTAALLVIYISTDRNASRKIVGMGFIGMLLLPILSLTPYWQKILSFIPFVGTVDTGTIDYRTRLFEQSMIVINRNPWFGSIDFRDTTEMISMIQGQGIIDIVNSYLGIALSYGFVGLFLFSSFFFIVLVNLRRSYKKLPAENSEMIIFGRAIFATLCAALITIATVSSISFVPYLHWSIAGLAVAYINIARETLIASKNNLPR
ncbi:MAG: O-antigen ligase family protein, partial [Hyphomicrobiales bacterium]|nr:O-antigen ligase family protein [Hyphomicrobiales bacterium]